MGTPVNLNRYRKEKARAQKKVCADQNAIEYGRSKSETEAVRLQQNKQRRDLDKHELDE